jgi:hypothetical protein
MRTILAFQIFTFSFGAMAGLVPYDVDLITTNTTDSTIEKRTNEWDFHLFTTNRCTSTDVNHGGVGNKGCTALNPHTFIAKSGKATELNGKCTVHLYADDACNQLPWQLIKANTCTTSLRITPTKAFKVTGC